MANNNDSFIIKDEQGNKIECEVLFTFESDETHKNYMVYTDYTKDESGNMKVYAVIYNPPLELEKQAFEPIETEEDWEQAQLALEQVMHVFEPIETEQLQHALEKFLAQEDDEI